MEPPRHLYSVGVRHGFALCYGIDLMLNLCHIKSQLVGESVDTGASGMHIVHTRYEVGCRMDLAESILDMRIL